MASLVRCKQQIANLNEQQPALEASFSKLTRQAWGDSKADCLSAFGSVGEVQKFLLDPGNIDLLGGEEHSAHQEEVTTGVAVQQADPSRTETIQAQARQRTQIWMWTIGGCITIVILLKFIRYLLEFSYDVVNSQRVVFFKIVSPRGDSKSDREREKELAKDMKEKISRMSQVYSSLHKIGKLSFTDNMMRWLFGKPKISLVLQYEEGTLYFVIGTYPEYRNIIESAISAQYSDASIEVIKRPNFFSKKYSDLMPLHEVKSAYYPIRTFKQLEDDPLNNIIDSLWKIPAEDAFTVIMTIKPEGNKFNKQAQKFAEALYKKDKSVTDRKPLWEKLLPWNWIGFFINGPSARLIERFTKDQQRGDPMVRMVKAEEDALNIMAEEAGKQAYQWGLMLVSCSDDKKRATENIYNVVSGYTVYKDEYNNELDQPETLADLFGGILKPLWRFWALFQLPNFFFQDNIFTINQLSSLFHLPDGLYNRSPTIKWLEYKMLSNPDNLPELKNENLNYHITGVLAEDYLGGDISKIFEDSRSHDVTHADGHAALKTYKDGVLLGVNVYRNRYTPVYISQKDRTRHQYIIGKSGTGKSVYIEMMARQDIWSGNGVCVVDPHGDLVESILKYIPKERAKDVIYFDAGNEERPMGLNLYEINHIAQADRAVNDATEIFLKMFGPEIFGPRIQEYFKYGSLTLLEDMEDGATLIDVPRLFTDDVYRAYKTKRAKNPVVRNFWEKTYNAMGDREKQEIIPYFTSKFVSFITNSLIRNIIGQTKSAFDFREVMDSKKILLINLSKGKIGELNSQLLGMIIVSKIYNAAMSRADVAEKDRDYFYLYVDEFQNFITDTFADILSEARKYKLCLIMAHQFIAQLDGSSGNNIWDKKSMVKDAVFGNVWTMQSFKVGAPDAEFLEKEYAPVLSAQDIIWVANYKSYIKLNIDNSTSRVFSINSIFTQDYKNDKVAEILKQYCAKKYGRKKEFVDAEISARLWMLENTDEIPVADQPVIQTNIQAWDQTGEQLGATVAQPSASDGSLLTEEQSSAIWPSVVPPSISQPIFSPKTPISEQSPTPLQSVVRDSSTMPPPSASESLPKV